MDALITTQKNALKQLKKERHHLTPQQYKTLKGQALTGDPEGALRGLRRIQERRRPSEHSIRQGPGNSDRKQPKD